jgi:hypothetical protein
VNGDAFSEQPRSTMNRRKAGQPVAAILFEHAWPIQS